MRSMYSKDELFINAAKKKPKWQELLNQLDDLDMDKISNLEEPKWVREALVILKQTDGISQKDRLLNIIKAANEADAKQYNERFIKYEVRKCIVSGISISGSIPYNDNVVWNVDLDMNEVFLLRSDDVIVISGEFYKIKQSEWDRLMSISEPFDSMTLQEYFNYYKDVYLINKY